MKYASIIILGLALGVNSFAAAQSSSSLAAPTPSVMPAPRANPAATESGSGLLHLPASTDPGIRKAGEILEQMVAALGGESYLTLHDIQQSGRTYGFYHGEPSGTGALFWRFWQWPDKERTELTKQRDWVILYLGDQGYEMTFKGTSAIENEPLQDYLRRRNHSLLWVLRRWLKEPGVALLYEGYGVAERKQGDKVSVINAQNDQVTIIIDTNTHLPLRVSFVWRDPKSRDRIEEAEGYDNYRSIQGIMTPFSVTRYRNGEFSNQRFITETKYNQNLPDTLFQAKLNITSEKGKKR
jgi:hypothetical protein